MLSIIVPFYNERESVGELYRLLLNILTPLGKPFEIIFVDDGSTDGTFGEIQKLSPVRGFRLRRNSGQTAAFGCGIAHARGETIVTLDGDLENRPEDIPRLLEELAKGYDVVAGWRKNRWHGQFFTRKIPSFVANRLISAITRVRLHDHGCNLRAYRREVFQGFTFNGEMHRMLAAYLGMQGARVTELPVAYIPRKYGKSKYGLSRTFRVLLDALASYFFREFSTRPMHFFGYVGFISIGTGFLSFSIALALRIFSEIHLNRTPLPEFTMMCVVVGVQFILMGLLAELLLRQRGQPAEARNPVSEEIERE